MANGAADDPRVASIFASADDLRAAGRVSAALRLETQAGIIRHSLTEMERVKAMRCEGECEIEHAYKWRHHVQALQSDIDAALSRVPAIMAEPPAKPSQDRAAARLHAHHQLYGGSNAKA
jgi:hypothetical protein